MIYIVSTGDMVTGGPETLHQLAGIYKNMGEKVAIYYIDPHSLQVPERFQKYGVKAVDEIVDSADNIVIVPETLTYILRRFKKIRVCISWLSLDNYYHMLPVNMVKWRIQKHQYPLVLFPIVFLAFLMKGKLHFGLYKFDDNGRYFHTYNCEYVKNFLESRGILDDKMIYICGSLNEEFFSALDDVFTEKRENLILYNPKKGLAFSEKIILHTRTRNLQVEFIPLINMKPAEIVILMKRAKIYMDFGNFPGPERLPREAVVLGCNIITSRNGAAGNDIDVPIPNELKFEDKDENIPEIIDKLSDMLQNYETYYPFYDEYRDKVINQIRLLNENTKIFLERI